MKDKPKLSREELSRIRSEAGRAGGKKRHENAKGRFPTRTMTVREPDYNVISAVAEIRQCSLAEAVHRFCVGWLKNHPDKAPQGWDEYIASHS